MLFWTIQVTILSFILIFLIHHLIHFFKSNLTVPKIKDLVNSSSEKYNNIYNIINKEKNDYEKNNNNFTLIDLLPNNNTNNENKIDMKDELKNFLKSQLHN
jgi:uncharacterized protein (UPF0333 family)